MIHRNFLLLAALCAVSMPAQTGRRPEKMDGSVHRAARQEDRSAAARAIRGMARPARRFSLRALTAAEARPITRKPGLTAVGVARALPADVLSQGEWSISPEGTRVWRLALESAGAEALRVHFKDFHAGSGKVWLLGTDAEGTSVTAGPYTGDGLFGDGDFWTDIVPGAGLIVAFEPAPDAAGTDALPFRIAELSHRQSARKTADESRPLAAAACALDVTCYPDYSEPAGAVALMVFESDGGTYECSGALISSASQPALPFFLTANHCISTAEEARSLITFFNYQTPSCGGQVPALSSRPRVTGATFVAGQPMALGDFTLLRLNAFPGVDVKVLGWTAIQIASNQTVTGISHPVGDYKRIAFGQRTRDVTIRFADGDRMPASVGYQVDWLQGVTQSGSSGSPLLTESGGKQYLVGTLTAGPDIDDDDSTLVCRTSNLYASYGRFSAAYPYLETALTSIDGNTGSSGALGTRQGTISATPVTFAAGQTAGRTTVSWQATGISQVQVRVGSPTGPAMTGISGPIGSADSGDWVVDGTFFYLQDASDGDSSGAAKTIASVRARVGSSSGGTGGATGTLTATPNPVTLAAGQTTGVTTLAWQTSGVSSVQIRIGSPTGPAMTGFEGPAGSATTGNWVADGTMFYLQDASDGNSSGAARTLATVRVQVATGGTTSPTQVTFSATPNPIVVPAGRRTGQTTLRWNAQGISRVQIRVNSADGIALTGTLGSSGSVFTSNFVTDGMSFYLQDARSGSSAGAAKTLAVVTVRVTSN